MYTLVITKARWISPDTHHALLKPPRRRRSSMTTVPETAAAVKARYAHVSDEPCTIAKVNGRLYVIFDDRIEDFTIEMAPFTVVLGECQLADDQALLDRIAGGAARIACTRLQEVA